MKRIITNGIYNQVTCTNCKCVYSFEATDITEDKKVTCPQCAPQTLLTLSLRTDV